MVHQELGLLVVPKGRLSPEKGSGHGQVMVGSWVSARLATGLVGHHDFQGGDLT